MKINALLFLVLSVPFSASAVEVSKADWLNAMSTALPTAFCQANGYFRQCFDITGEECEDTAASATRICLKKHNDSIPEILVQPEDGTRWGSLIGRCAGEAFDATLANKRKNTEQCNDVSNWQ